MKRARGMAWLFLCVSILAVPSSWGEETQRQRAEGLWSQREELGNAREATSAWQALLTESLGEYEVLLRLSRLHY